jgi:uncharacterized protein (DUF983 family)
MSRVMCAITCIPAQELRNTMTTGKADPQALRNLPPTGWPRTRTLISRALLRRCPQCGGKGIFKNYLELRETCPTCAYRFDREEGYFLGSYGIGVVLSGLIPLILLIFAFKYTDLDWVTLELIFIPMAILLPLILFPFTRTMWMMIDLIVDQSEKQDKNIRHHHMQERP